MSHTAPVPFLTVHRLEAVEVASARAFVDVTPSATGIDALGGYAAMMGDGSPLTHVIGAGLDAAWTLAELQRVERFYSGHGTGTVLELCPMIDAAFLGQIQERGYRVEQFENLLVTALPAPVSIAPAEPAVVIRRVDPGEAEDWAQLMARAFFSRGEVSAEEAAIGVPVARATQAYVAEIDGRPAATGAMFIHDEVAFLMTDGTLPGFRGRGLQQALIQRRIQDAIAQGARHAMASTVPNSGSQSNYLRNGFRVLYTKFTASRRRRR
jgi:GNAT superfamily N-acetyltransferase